MSSDLDVPLLPSAEQIRKRGFVTVRKGGFDPDQVREFLGRVADQVEVLEKESRELRMATGSKQAQGQGQPTRRAKAQADDPYEAISKRFAALLENADREATSVIAEAKIEAARILEQARAEADRINLDSQARAEEARQQAGEALAQAHEEAQRILGGLSRASRVDDDADERDAVAAAHGGGQPRRVAGPARRRRGERDGGRGDGAPRRAGGAPARPAGACDRRRPRPPNRRRPRHRRPRRRRRRPTPTKPAPGEADDLVDPRYEDLWASTDTAVDLPDLATLDVNFDDEPGSG